MKAVSNMTIGWINQPLPALFNERHIIYSLRNEDESNFRNSHLSVDAYNTDDDDDDVEDDDEEDNDEEELGMYY